MSNDVNVKNNYDGNLNVAGVDVAAGAEVAVDETKLKQWMNGHAAKIWVEQGLISFDGSDEMLAEEPDEGENERQELLAKAKELGLKPRGNTGIDKLNEMIAEAEAEGEPEEPDEAEAEGEPEEPDEGEGEGEGEGSDEGEGSGEESNL